MTQQMPKESLAQRADRLRRAQRASSTGPLLVAEEVVEIDAHWERLYRAEAGGVECTTWCRKALGKSLDYYLRRAHAVSVLGEAVRRTVDHEVAVWLVSKLSDETREKAKLALIRECKKRDGHPLTYSMAQRTLRAMKLIDPQKHRHCKRCEQLERILEEHGIEVP